jgi:hypothetical protein
MKNKALKLQRMKRLVFFILALTLTNCQIDEDTVPQKSNIQTISIEEATLFLSQSSNSLSRLSKKGEVKPEFGKITLEKIINNEQLLTVIPLSTKDRNQNSRIVMLKVKGEIKSAVINMYPEKNIHKGKFSGKILIYDLNGNFINGFRVDNGDIVTQFIKSNKKTNKSNTNRVEGEEPIFLNEVVVINRYKKSYSLELAYFSWDFPNGIDGGGNGEPDQSFMWDSGGGSGGDSIIYSDLSLKSEIESTDSNAFDINFIQDQNTTTAKVSFNLLPWTGVRILINQNPGKMYTIQSVSSDTFGLTMGYVWSQTSYDQITKGNKTTINVYGNLTYTLWAQGIGNIYTSPITFEIVIDNTNGHIISGKRH